MILVDVFVQRDYGAKYYQYMCLTGQYYLMEYTIRVLVDKYGGEILYNLKSNILKHEWYTNRPMSHDGILYDSYDTLKFYWNYIMCGRYCNIWTVL